MAGSSPRRRRRHGCREQLNVLARAQKPRQAGCCPTTPTCSRLNTARASRSRRGADAADDHLTLVRGSSPASSARSVDLPEPDGPVTTVSVPGLNDASTPPRLRSPRGRPRDGRRRRSPASLPEKRKPSWGTMPSWPRRARWRTVAGRGRRRRRALLGVVEARDELREGRLAGAGGADKGQGLPGRHVQVDVAQRPIIRPRSPPLRLVGVGEPDALHLDLAADLTRVDGPGRVDHVRSGVEQVEDLVERRHPLLVGRVELGELLDRFEEGRQVADEGDDHADLDRPVDRRLPP